MFFQDCMDGSLQISNPFSMNHANFQNALFLANLQIGQQHVLHFARLDGVQVQNAIDWQLHRFSEFVLRWFRHVKAKVIILIWKDKSASRRVSRATEKQELERNKRFEGSKACRI